MAKRNKKKKASRKHGNKCKCPECKSNRSEKRAETKQKRRNRHSKDMLYKGVPWEQRWGSAGESNKNPGFLAGGHPKLKRDLTFEDSYSEPLSDLHLRARNAIKRQLPDNTYTQYLTNWWHTTRHGPSKSKPKLHRIYRAYQFASEQDSFSGLMGGCFQHVNFLWHGTSFTNVSSIGHQGLEVRGSRCLMGAGIYLAPAFAKAWMFGGQNPKIVLLCAVKLGKVFTAFKCSHNPRCAKDDKDCDGRKIPNGNSIKALGFDTAVAFAGPNSVAWGGRMRHTEYCCYDAAQVLPVYVLVFKE